MTELFVKEVLAITAVVLFIMILVLVALIFVDVIVNIVRDIWRGW